MHPALENLVLTRRLAQTECLQIFRAFHFFFTVEFIPSRISAACVVLVVSQHN